MSLFLLASHEFAPFICRPCLSRLSTVATRQQQHHHRSFTSSSALRNQSSTKLPTAPARTRFAPSPTGLLHLGSLRTALFNYLLAKKTGGQFLLRIEDTDQARTIPGVEKKLYQDLRWAGLQWDEGPEVGGPYGPYRQSERTSLYQEHAQKLLESGHAYRCFCSAERLKELADMRHQLGLPTEYDRTCAHVSKEESDDRSSRGESHVVRLRVPDYYPKYKDVVFGTVQHKGRVGVDAYEDPILLKSDGYPTYHLANVVDDHHMEITHVIRGSEWISSTPKHVALYQAFGWAPPEFAHVGLLTDENGNKLSKRKMDIGIDSFRDQGIFPETLVNFAALLGWSHKGKSDVMSLAELVDNFSLKFTKGNTIVTFGKLHFLQRAHASARIRGSGQGLQEMIDEIVAILEKKYPEDLTAMRGSRSVAEYITPILQLEHKKYLNAEDFISQTSYLYHKLPLSTKHSTNAAYFGDYVEVPESEWTKETLKKRFDDIYKAAAERAAQQEATRPSTKEYFHSLREALTGQHDGPGIFDIMTILGREETLRRLGVGETPKPV